jgi:hypothetical protein
MSHKVIYAGIIVTMVLAVGLVVYWERPPAAPPVDATWEAELQAKSAEINKSLPTQVDAETVLVSTAVKGNTIEFRHSLINTLNEEVDVPQTTGELYPILRAAACSSAELEIYRDHGTTLQYVYYDKEGNYAFGIKVETRDCK